MSTFVSVFDAVNGTRKMRTELFEEEKARGELVETVGWQLTTSDDERLVALSYEQHREGFWYKTTRREPRFLVLDLQRGRTVGLVRHARQTLHSGWAVVSPAAGGRLLFSPDGRYLFTTTRYTRQWALP